ncbi:MAG: hypothetical protein ACE15C_19745 [Phycisphaerae bacterium]
MNDTGWTVTQQIQAGEPIGQTFTAISDNRLSMVSMYVADMNASVAPTDYSITFSLYEGIGTQGRLLGTRAYTALSDGFSGYAAVDFSSVTLVDGEMYTVALSNDTARWGRVVVGNQYAGGTALYAGAQSPSSDALFRIQWQILSIGGDANLDGIVDMTDYIVWYNNYGQTGAGWSGADFNLSGLTDMTDYIVWFNNFGQMAPAALPAASADPDISDTPASDPPTCPASGLAASSVPAPAAVSASETDESPAADTVASAPAALPVPAPAAHRHSPPVGDTWRADEAQDVPGSVSQFGTVQGLSIPDGSLGQSQAPARSIVGPFRWSRAAGLRLGPAVAADEGADGQFADVLAITALRPAMA